VLRQNLDNVKQIVTDSLKQLMDREEKIDLLVVKTQ
jgi:hypothetical protein